LGVAVDERMSSSSVVADSTHGGAAAENARSANQSPLRPWLKEVASAGGTQRRA